MKKIRNKYFGEDLEKTSGLMGIIYILTIFVGFFIQINYIIPFFIAIFVSIGFLESGIILEKKINITNSLIWFINASIISILI